MSVEKSIETSENLFGFPQIEVAFSINKTLIFEEIIKELQAYLLSESDDTDSTDHIFDFLTTISDQIPLEFEEVLQSNSKKKRFLRALSKIFTLLLNTMVNTADKTKKYLKSS